MSPNGPAAAPSFSSAGVCQGAQDLSGGRRVVRRRWAEKVQGVRPKSPRSLGLRGLRQGLAEPRAARRDAPVGALSPRCLRGRARAHLAGVVPCGFGLGLRL